MVRNNNQKFYYTPLGFITHALVGNFSIYIAQGGKGYIFYINI